MIASGSSERGLSEVTIARSEPLGAGPAHLRPLVAVAVAAGAEDRDHPALGQPAGGAEDVVERVGRVGVVDEDGEVLALVDRLEAARNTPRPGQARGGLVRVDFHRDRGGEGAERVGDVEVTGHQRAHRRSPPPARDGEARAGRVEGDVAGGEVRVGALGREGQALEVLAPGAGRRRRRR